MRGVSLWHLSARPALLVCVLMLSACGPTLLRPSSRGEVAEALKLKADSLMSSGELEGAPLNSTELVLALYRSHPKLYGRVPSVITPKGLRSLGVRRAEAPQVGDLLIFKPLKDTLDVAVVLEVVKGQAVRAIALLRGAPRELKLHLKLPSARRLDDELINSYVRRAAQAQGGRAQGADEALEPSGYLAGELLDEVRALF